MKRIVTDTGHSTEVGVYVLSIIRLSDVVAVVVSSIS
jgi:hypothetical protein